MKQWLYTLMLFLVLSGCAAFDDAIRFGQYRFPYLRQLVGHHISEVTDRVSGVRVADGGLFGGKEYYLYQQNEYSHTVNTYNGYGVLIGQEHKYNRGHIMLVTDSKGYITRYIESGYIPLEGTSFDRTMRSALRDILVFEE